MNFKLAHNWYFLAYFYKTAVNLSANAAPDFSLKARLATDCMTRFLLRHFQFDKFVISCSVLLQILRRMLQLFSTEELIGQWFHLSEFTFKCLTVTIFIDNLVNRLLMDAKLRAFITIRTAVSFAPKQQELHL